MPPRMLADAAGLLAGARVVYTDLDGTMLGPRGSFVHAPGGGVSLEPVEALAAAHEAGVEVVPISGRALRGLQSDSRILGLGTCIGEMGGVLSYGFGTEVVENFGATPRPGSPAEVMESEGVVAALLGAYEGRLEPHTPWTKGRTVTQLFRGLVDASEASERLAAAGHGWVGLHDNGRLHGGYLGLDPGACRAYHLLPKGVSKAGALALDRARRGIERRDAVAIGDSAADLELAAEVHAFVLVGDALEGDPALAAAIEHLDNVVVTERPMNLGWTDAIRAITRG